MANKKKQQNDELQNVQEALNKSEVFLENYRKPILIGLSSIIIVVLAIIAFSNLYIAPREQEASDRMIACVDYFEMDSFALALNGDGINEGFATIADSYSMTKSADLAAYYAGVCCYHLGQYEDAISYLDRFDAKTVNATPIAIGLKGDCYSTLGDVDKAVKLYEKAAAFNNEATAPIYLKKAGIAYEHLGEYAKAEKAYKSIKDNYSASQTAMDIDKYIEHAKAMQK